MSIRILPSLSFLFCFCFYANAQGTFQPKRLDTTPRGIVYNKEMSVNITAHTAGISVGFDFGKIQTYYKTKYYHIEIGELKHPREKRSDFQSISNPTVGAARSYVFGKQNNLYVVRAGLGTKRYLSEKSKDRGVAVGINYELGPTLGLLKPYYLETFVPNNEIITRAQTRSIKYTPETAAIFKDVSRIFGASRKSKGFGEITPTFGVHGKFSVHFDWGAFDEFVKSIDIGVMVDGFLKETPIMIDGDGINTESVENRNLFLNLFVKATLGKRR